MSRRNRIISTIGFSFVGLILVLVVTSVLIMRSDWFHNFVREKIIAVTEESTGGKVDIGSFDFDWTHLRATIRNFVLHGTEPAGQAPLFQASLIQLDLKLFSGIKGIVDLAALKVDRPQANIIVYPDGNTNVPEPKIKKPSNTSGLETVVDLKVGHFDVENGTLLFNAQKAEFHAKGDNLHAELFYNVAHPSYKGQLAVNPLFLTAGKNTPVNLNVVLPVLLEKDRIQLTDAKITTSESQITINASVEHMLAPRTSAHVNARLALDDVKRLADLGMPIQTGKDLPTAVDADLAVSLDENTIKISTARVTLGESNIEASGTLKDPSGNGAVQFNTSLALGQIGRLLNVAARPEGSFEASGTAKLTGQSDYAVDASIHGKGLAFRSGAQRFSGIGVTGELKADPKKIALDKFKLAAFGGEVTGSADLENMQRFNFDGGLHGFNIRTLARTFASQDLPYDGSISGPVKASGDIKAPGTKGIQADVHLAIAPGRNGVPVSGRINADYNGVRDLVSVADSYVALPNTRLDLSGSLDRELQIKLVSRNLSDFEPALAMGSKGKPAPLPIQLRGGALTFTGAVTGKLAAPQIAGHIQATNFALEDRPFDRFSADLKASPQGAQIDGGSLAHGPTQMQFAGSVGLKNWSPEPYEPLNVNANIRNADVADLLALAGQKDVPATGTLNASAQVNGTIGNPRGGANLSIANGTAYDEHFDSLAANVDFSDQLVRLRNTQLVAGTAHIDFNGTFQHPKNSFSEGTIQAHLASNQVSLDQFNAIRKQNKGLSGTAQINADVAANLRQVKGQTEFLLTSVNGNASAHSLTLEGKKLGDFTAAAQTSGSNVNFNVNSDFAGSTIRVNGQTQLQSDYPTTASASIANLPIEQVLAVADRRDINAKGNLSANAQVSGTLANPQASADINLTKAVIYDEPLDRVQGRFTYNNQLIDIPNLEIVEGPARIDVAGSFQHPKGDLQEGQVRFHLASNQIQIGRLHIVQQQKPGLNGTLQIGADGAGTLRKLPKGSTEPPILFSSLNANVDAHGIDVNKKALGDLTLKAQTQGSNLVFNLDSDLGQSKIHGQGQAQLNGNYPVTAQVSFANLTYAGLQPLLTATTTTPPAFDVLAEGQANISGQALKPEELGGNLTVSKLEVTAKPIGPAGLATPPIKLANQGPIVVALKQQVLTVQTAEVTGQNTNIKVTGVVSMNAKTPLNLQVNANTDLKILQSFNRDIYSEGQVAMQVVVRGTFTQPLVNGQLRLQNASFNMVDLPNGLSNANGVVQFNGTSAVIQNLTAETGGGKVQAGGFVGFGNGNLRYGLHANTTDVRVRNPQGISVTISAAVNLTGTSDHSVLGGTATINRMAFNPKSDFGSLLSRASPPPETPSAPSGVLAGLKLDIRIRTAPDMAVQTSMAQNLQADADLTLRGTLDNPGMLGRVNVTSGKLVFFGTTYDVNNGSVAFYNPLAIDPILNVDLETKAQGVDVILTVSGPVNNMKLTYRSDPPLQFSEIVALLATGKTPTSDPTILANQPAPPPQTMQQMGESAIVSQAVAGPVSDRLQRVFGISQLKIDPTFTSGSALPQARLTLQQQVASNLTFTYIEDLTQSNSQIIRVEWAVNPQWSAVATRDQFGRFGIDFFYKKQFR